jgi:hypothetical protein
MRSLATEIHTKAASENKFIACRGTALPKFLLIQDITIAVPIVEIEEFFWGQTIKDNQFCLQLIQSLDIAIFS